MAWRSVFDVRFWCIVHVRLHKVERIWCSVFSTLLFMTLECNARSLSIRQTSAQLDHLRPHGLLNPKHEGLIEKYSVASYVHYADIKWSAGWQLSTIWRLKWASWNIRVNLHRGIFGWVLSRNSKIVLRPFLIVNLN